MTHTGRGSATRLNALLFPLRLDFPEQARRRDFVHQKLMCLGLFARSPHLMQNCTLGVTLLLGNARHLGSG